MQNNRLSIHQFLSSTQPIQTPKLESIFKTKANTIRKSYFKYLKISSSQKPQKQPIFNKPQQEHTPIPITLPLHKHTISPPPKKQQNLKQSKQRTQNHQNFIEMFTKISKEKKDQYRKAKELINCKNQANINFKVIEKYCEGCKKGVVSLRNYSYKQLNAEQLNKIYKSRNSDRKGFTTKIKRGSNFSRPKMPVQSEISYENARDKTKTEGSNKKDEDYLYQIDNFSELFSFSSENQAKACKLGKITTNEDKKKKYVSQGYLNRETIRSSTDTAQIPQIYSPESKYIQKRHSFKITTHNPEKSMYNKTYQHIMGSSKPIHAKLPLTRTKTNFIRDIHWRTGFMNKTQNEENMEQNKQENELGPWAEDVI